MEMPKGMRPHFEANRTLSTGSTDLDILDELDFIGAPLDDEYSQAYHKGKQGKCSTHYSGCSISIFKMLNI